MQCADFMWMISFVTSLQDDNKSVECDAQILIAVGNSVELSQL
jgi:hypothetical protein